MTGAAAEQAAYEAWRKTFRSDAPWADIGDQERRAWTDAVQAGIAIEAPALANQAIGLFLEYRDMHGHDEDYARAAAVLEVAEGASVTKAEITLAAEETYPPPDEVASLDTDVMEDL